MRGSKLPSTHAFIGRRYEWDLLTHEYERPHASLVVVYGRRRVGKTRLIHEFYQDKNVWRFDGVEGGNKASQIQTLLSQLSVYTKNDLYASLRCDHWIDLFKIVDKAIETHFPSYGMTLVLDELQYMASQHAELVSAMKWIWDNRWHDKPSFSLVLCGSVASFMIQKVIKSSSLYGRITLEIALKPFSIPETSQFFSGQKSIREICDLYMFCGGIPEYLLRIDPQESIALNISRLAFCRNGYFVDEFDRLFKDIFRQESMYKSIILALSRHKSLKVPELTHQLGVSEGGGFVGYLYNLESAGFVSSLIPWDKLPGSKLKRYGLSDEYLLFFFTFIYPNLRRIRENTHIALGLSILKGQKYKTWAGFAFERLCLKHVDVIMRCLNIDQLVKGYGPYFDRKSNTKEGTQIDLLFSRHDPVITLCELKYHEGLVGKWVIKEVEKKVALLEPAEKTIEKVLITSHGATQDLEDTRYFSRVLTLETLFGA